jgi:hypothetical protein
MTAYLTQAPTGVEGDITRPDFSEVEPAMLVAVSGVFAAKYGIPMKLVAGGMSQWEAANVAGDFAGILIREAPSMAGDIASDANANGATPWPLTPKGLLKKGYCNVKCAYGTPVRGGIVYIAVDTNQGAIGDFQATANGAHNIALPQSIITWATDGKDANNNAEVRLVDTNK